MSRRWLPFLLGGVFLTAIFLFQTSPPVTAGDSLDRQVGQILKNQEKILQELQEIRKELDVIRVRVR